MHFRELSYHFLGIALESLDCTLNDKICYFYLREDRNCVLSMIGAREGQEMKE